VVNLQRAYAKTKLHQNNGLKKVPFLVRSRPKNKQKPRERRRRERKKNLNFRLQNEIPLNTVYPKFDPRRVMFLPCARKKTSPKSQAQKGHIFGAPPAQNIQKPHKRRRRECEKMGFWSLKSLKITRNSTLVGWSIYTVRTQKQNFTKITDLKKGSFLARPRPKTNRGHASAEGASERKIWIFASKPLEIYPKFDPHRVKFLQCACKPQTSLKSHAQNGHVSGAPPAQKYKEVTQVPKARAGEKLGFRSLNSLKNTRNSTPVG